MKRCEVVTFQFAHNYGAQLQCYALKTYIESLGIEVTFSQFVPDKEKRIYANIPYVSLKNIRHTIYEIVRCLKRRKQYKLFEKFIEQENCENNSNQYDYVIFGSDQIWNEKITGRIFFYYGESFETTNKIAYAGSFGANELTEFQKENVKKYLALFSHVSVREECNIEEVCSLLEKNIVSVLDPVFLLKKDAWYMFENAPKSKCKEEFILYYALEGDELLIEETKKLAKRNGLVVYAIHPICLRQGNGFTQLYDVGPREFIYLVNKAKYICTNSFHAVSFSSILGKKLVYKSFRENESRVPALLKYFGIQYELGEILHVDFENKMNKCIYSEIEKSKGYLKSALEIYE